MIIKNKLLETLFYSSENELALSEPKRKSMFYFLGVK